MPYDVFSLDLGIVRGLQSVFFTQRSKTNEGSLFRECISERIPFILVVIGLARPVRPRKSGPFHECPHSHRTDNGL